MDARDGIAAIFELIELILCPFVGALLSGCSLLYDIPVDLDCFVDLHLILEEFVLGGGRFGVGGCYSWALYRTLLYSFYTLRTLSVLTPMTL